MVKVLVYINLFNKRDQKLQQVEDLLAGQHGERNPLAAAYHHV